MNTAFHKPNTRYWQQITQKPNCKQCAPFIIISGETIVSTFYLYGALGKSKDTDTIVHSIFGYRRFNIDTFCYTGKELKIYWHNRKNPYAHEMDVLPVITPDRPKIYRLNQKPNNHEKARN